MDKTFTPREVDSLIPKLEGIFQHMDACHKRVHELAQSGTALSAHPSAVEIADDARIRAQMEFLLQAVQEDVNIIGGLGGVVKDIENGLVDFPGWVEGQEVWLCWKRGEDKIHFWHPLDSGFSDRLTLNRGEARAGPTH